MNTEHAICAACGSPEIKIENKEYSFKYFNEAVTINPLCVICSCCDDFIYEEKDLTLKIEEKKQLIESKIINDFFKLIDDHGHTLLNVEKAMHLPTRTLSQIKNKMAANSSFISNIYDILRIPWRLDIIMSEYNETTICKCMIDILDSKQKEYKIMLNKPNNNKSKVSSDSGLTVSFEEYTNKVESVK